MINSGAVDSATDLEVVPSSPLKLELLLEEKIDKVCNEAFDKLLAQEFNPDQDDFEDDMGLESDVVKDVVECKDKNSRFAELVPFEVQNWRSGGKRKFEESASPRTLSFGLPMRLRSGGVATATTL